MESVVETLGEAVDAAAAVDLDTLTDAESDAELVELVRQRHRLDAEIARRAARWDTRGVWQSDGSRAPWARLSRTASLSPGTAKQILRHGRDVAAMPRHRPGVGGRRDRRRPRRPARPAPPATAATSCSPATRAVLVGQCDELTFGQVVKAIQYWCQRADAELDHDGTPPPKPGSLRINTGFDGTVTGDFTLDPIAGATVTEALRRIERDLYRQDQRDGVIRTTSERMAAALVEMAVRASTVPAGGRRPEPLICILAGEATVEQLCELATGVVIHPGLIVPHLDRSQVQTFIFDGADKVIAASKQRTFRGMLRRAIQVRDRHCQHPSGCDEPITHCDVDHRTAYTDGGITAEANGRPGMRVAQPQIRPPRPPTRRRHRSRPPTPRTRPPRPPTTRTP